MRKIFPVIGVILDKFFDKLEIDHIKDVDNQRDFMLRQHAEEFLDVKFQTNKLQQGIYVSINFIFWMVLSLLIVWIFISSNTMFVFLIFNNLIILPFLIFMLSYNEQAFIYKKYSGFGNDSLIENRFGKSLLINSIGISTSVIDIPWHNVLQVSNLDENSLIFILKKEKRLSLKIYPKPPLYLVFPSTKEKERFFDCLKKYSNNYFDITKFDKNN